MPSDNKELSTKIDEWYNDWNVSPMPTRIKAKLEALIADQCRLARVEETKLYEDWFNNDNTTHVEDFIEDRVKILENKDD